MNEKKVIELKKENIFCKKAQASYLQIIVLVISTFAFSYFIYESSKILDEKQNQLVNENKNSIIKTVLKNFLLKAIDEVSFIKSVSAAEENPTANDGLGGLAGFEKQVIGQLSLNCCPKLKNNATCQNIANVQCKDICAVDCIPTKCEQTTNCKLGTCFDKNEGICSINSPKGSCEANKGKWINDKTGNAAECQNGCCLLGTQAQFLTQTRCQKLSEKIGISANFKSEIRTEIECLALASQQDEGACVIVNGETRNCIFTTRAVCLKNRGEFFKGYLCSNPELNTNCEKQKTVNCVEGKNEVYWFDSCGNKENIYDANKAKSWNNGKILSKEQSCLLSIGNNLFANQKTCGNCNFLTGSICSRKSSSEKLADSSLNQVCKNINCKDAPGNAGTTQDRKNGESWCVYDSYIGDGKDAPGSRHYKYYCIDGEVKNEPCGDMRTSICVESEIDGQNRKTFSNAACRPNRALECVGYNAGEDKEKLRKECQDNPDCQIRSIDFGKKYQFNICTPKYPRGFLQTENAEITKVLCNQANFQCTKIKVKGIGGWKTVAGNKCDSAEFTQQMNDWCASMGDCGMSTNVLGKVTDDGYSVSNAPKINKQNYAKYAIPVIGQKAEPGDISEIMARYYGWGATTGPSDYEPKSIESIGIMETVIGIGGFMGVITALSGVGTIVSTTSAFFAGFAANTLTALAGAVAGYIIAKMFGLQGDAFTATVIGGAIGGIVGGLAFAASVGGSTTALASLGAAAALGTQGFLGALVAGGVFGLAAAIAIMTIMKIMGIGKVKKTVAQFTCNPWQAPRGGDDCGKCNTKNPLQPCTKYKCQTFGQLCEFINEGTGSEMCTKVDIKDVNPPVITPWKELISPGYKYDEINDDGFKITGQNGECITEYTPVIFGISTNKVSQCKYDVVHTDNYDAMSNFIMDDNLYRYNHTMAFNIPSVESLFGNMNDEDYTDAELANLKAVSANKLGELNYYVRCIDKAGTAPVKEYTIRTCVKPGPDLTPPYITKSTPADGSYVAFNQNITSLNIWLSEPANCKYSSNKNKSFEEMENSFTCLTDAEDIELYGWNCNTTINNLARGDNRILIKCRDQPWLAGTINESQRNTMQEAEITLIKSQTELRITEISPNATITAGTEPATAVLKVKTDGGVENGKSVCGFSFTGYNQIADTFSSDEEYTLSMMLNGKYTVYVKCIDIGGNIAQASSGFEIQIDNNAPQVARAYQQSESLTIITDEPSQCTFRTDSNSKSICSFNWENGTLMSGADLIHTTSFDDKLSYYIKCQDVYGNSLGSGCNIIVKRGRSSAPQQL